MSAVDKQHPAALATSPDHLVAEEVRQYIVERLAERYLDQLVGGEPLGLPPVLCFPLWRDACGECGVGLTATDEHVAAADGRVWCIPCAGAIIAKAKGGEG